MDTYLGNDTGLELEIGTWNLELDWNRQHCETPATYNLLLNTFIMFNNVNQREWEWERDYIGTLRIFFFLQFLFYDV